MSEPPTGRTNADGFTGGYPKPQADLAEELYSKSGMEPPWLLEYQDGQVVVGPAAPAGPPTPRHEA